MGYDPAAASIEPPRHEHKYLPRVAPDTEAMSETMAAADEAFKSNVFASTLCAGKARPNVAVVVWGSLRTFINPVVHRSIIHNYVASFGAKPTYFFNMNSHISEFDTDKLNAMKLDRMSRLNEEIFRPVVTKDMDPTPTPISALPGCKFLKDSPIDVKHCDTEVISSCNLQAAYNIYGGLARIWPDIAAVEESSGVQFDWVIAARSDAVVFQGLYPHCLYSSYLDHIHSFQAGMFFLMPRKHAHVVFGLYDRSLKECNRSRPNVYDVESLLVADANEMGITINEELIPKHCIMRMPGSFMLGPMRLANMCPHGVLGDLHLCVDALYDNPTNAMNYSRDYADFSAAYRRCNGVIECLWDEAKYIAREEQG